MSAGTGRVRDFIYHAAWITGLSRLLERRARRGVTILMYHRVLPRELGDRYLHGLSLTPDVFGAQLQWLSEHARVMPVSEALETIGGRATSKGRPIVCVTFDDGYWDNAAIAAPLLDAHRMRGTFYITTGFVLRGAMLWFDRAASFWAQDPVVCAEVLAGSADRKAVRKPGSFSDWMSLLKDEPEGERVEVLRRVERVLGAAEWTDLNRPMTVGEARSLASGGHEIGSHSVSHPILTTVDDGVLPSELRESGDELRRVLGCPIPGFCYPNGSSDQRVSAAVREAGYAYACTTKAGLNEPSTDLFALRRNHVHKNTVTKADGSHSEPSFAAVVWGLHAQVRRGARRLGIAA
ncbi:MAG: polysaccharide deacetylase family protein [Phycisphaerae bacterium]|nr:polysaccharide deacetylase family protein [Phycisphaerae bacterium]